MTRCLLIVIGFGFLSACTSTEKRRKPVGPPSAESNMPWNAPQPGEGNAAFGGVFDQFR